MARFGLSPYSNPVETGIDSFVKLSGAFNQKDRLEMERSELEMRQQEATQRREMNRMNLQREQNALDEEEANKPVREAKRKKELRDYENEALLPQWESAEREFHAAATEGREPQFSPDQAAAIEVAAKRSKVDLGAIHDLADHVQKWMPVVQQSQQNQVRLDDPQMLADFNKAYGPQLAGKNVKAIFFDKTAYGGKGGFAFGTDDGNGGTAPLTTKDGQYILQIPADQVLNDVVHHGIAASIIEASRYNSDPKYREQVRTKETELQQGAVIASKMDEFQSWVESNPDATVNDRRAHLYSSLVKAGVSSDKAEKVAKDQIADRKPRNLIKIEEGDPSRPGYKRDALIDQDSGDRIFTGQGRQEFRPPAPLRPESSSKKEEKTNARRDKLINETMLRLRQDPEWKEETDGAVRNEAERIADAQIAGASPGPNLEKQQKKRVQPLKDKFGSTKTGWGGTDFDYLIGSALKKGYTADEIRDAAVGTPAADAVANYKFPAEQTKASASESPVEKKNAQSAPRRVLRRPASIDLSKFDS